MRARSIFFASIASAILISGCYTKVRTSGWPSAMNPDVRPVPREVTGAPPVASHPPVVDDGVLRGEFVGTVQFDFNAGSADERTYSSDISFRFQDGMYRCESNLIVERGRYKDQGKEIIFDPPLPLPTAERPQHWVTTGARGISRFVVEHQEGSWQLTSRDEKQNRNCEIALRRLFESR